MCCRRSGWRRCCEYKPRLYFLLGAWLRLLASHLTLRGQPHREDTHSAPRRKEPARLGLGHTLSCKGGHFTLPRQDG